MLMLLISLLFFSDILVFYFLYFQGSILYTCLCWSGGVLNVEAFSHFSLLLLSLSVFSVISIFEPSPSLLKLSSILIYVCFFFFAPSTSLLFFFFFEFSVFPLLVMIGVWGEQVEKISASYFLLIYTFVGVFPFLWAFSWSSGMPFIYHDTPLSKEGSILLLFMFLAKTPLFLLHFWLPKAHVEAPTTASILLAALLLKFGSVGLYRLLTQMKYMSSLFILGLSLMGALIISLVCCFSSDSKKYAAFSSVVHMNFVVSLWGTDQSLSLGFGFVLMLLHGYISMMLFYSFGLLYHVSGTRSIFFLKGLMMGGIGVSLVVSTTLLGNAGAPPLLSFFIEFFSYSCFLQFLTFFWGGLFFLFMILFYLNLFFYCHLSLGFSCSWESSFPFLPAGSIYYFIFAPSLFFLIL